MALSGAAVPLINGYDVTLHCFTLFRQWAFEAL